MRILYVFHSLAVWGGIERVLVDKMNHLAKMYDDEVFMLTTDQGNHSVPYQLEPKVHLEDLGICFHHQYRHRGVKRWMMAHRLSCLYEKLLSERIQVINPDVIVCTTSNYQDINLLVRLKKDIPLVVESHSICRATLGQKGLKNRFTDYMYRWGLTKAQVIVALTEEDAADWRSIHPCVRVIPNIVHLNDGNVSSYDHKRVIFVGRLDYQKRPMEMIEIWRMVYPKFPDWHLDIYGEGQQLQELEDVVHSLDMHIHIHQPTEHIFEAYRNSSILVSTSSFEPFGLVIPEAMSCGLPVVAYDCPFGPQTIINDGDNGFLVENNDRRAFADRLCLLMSNISLCKKIGQVASLSVQQYSAEVIMPKWRELFLGLLSS